MYSRYVSCCKYPTHETFQKELRRNSCFIFSNLCIFRLCSPQSSIFLACTCSPTSIQSIISSSIITISSSSISVNNTDCYICTLYYNNINMYIINPVLHLCIQTLIWPWTPLYQCKSHKALIYSSLPYHLRHCFHSLKLTKTPLKIEKKTKGRPHLPPTINFQGVC